MRILHCIPTMAGGGGERQLSYLAAALARRGVETHVVLKAQGPNLDRLCASGATLHCLPDGGNHSPRLFWTLHRLLGELRPNLVQTWLRQMDILGGAAALVHRVPWILSERNSALAYPRSLKHVLRTRLARQASAVISNSKTGDDYWKGRVPTDRRFLIPNGLPLDEIARATPLARERVPLAPGEKLILFAGRFEAQKNLENLLMAVSRALEQVQARAVFCGAGPDREKLQALLRQCHLRERVVLQGYISDLWAWMKRADVFVSASWHEGRPNAVLEAMACGCPLVVSDIPEHREFLDETAALIVPPDDVRAIADALVRGVTETDASRARAAKGLAKSYQWSVDAMAGVYVEAYETILRRCGRRSDSQHASPLVRSPAALVSSASRVSCKS